MQVRLEVSPIAALSGPCLPESPSSSDILDTRFSWFYLYLYYPSFVVSCLVISYFANFLNINTIRLEFPLIIFSNFFWATSFSYVLVIMISMLMA